MTIGVIRGGARLPLNQLFIHYMQVMRRERRANWDDEVAMQAESTLRRLDWLLYQVRVADLEFQNPSITNDRMGELMLAIPTLTEAWYYIAFRTMRMVRDKCPNLNTFEVRQITIVRNHLIEHPNQKNAGSVYSGNFATGTIGGPEVKGARWDGQSEAHRDEGVYAAATEFDETLRALLDPYVLMNLQQQEEHS